MTSEKISVIVPAYNRADLIGETIQSVQAQTLREWEMIIVDDHSTDDTLAVARRFSQSDSRIRVYMRQSKRKGAPVCRNEGARHARGELFVFLDSDDLLAPECLEKRRAVMTQNEPALDMAIFQTELFHERPGDMGLCVNRLDYADDLEHFLSGDGVWLTTGPIWRKTAFFDIGGWDEDLPCSQDWELNVRVLTSGAVYKKIDTVDSYHRQNHEKRDTISSRVKTYHYIKGSLMATEKASLILKKLPSPPANYIAGLRYMTLRRLFKLSKLHYRRLAVASALRLYRQKDITSVDVMQVFGFLMMDAVTAKLLKGRDALGNLRYAPQRSIARKSVNFRWPSH